MVRPRRHPLVPLTLLLSVLLIAMFAQTPMLTLCAFVGATLYLITAGRTALTRRSVIGYLILWALVAVTNPLFSTGGATPIVFIGGDSMLQSRDISLPTKVRVFKAMVFLVVLSGCVTWAIKKTECRRTDAFELWC